MSPGLSESKTMGQKSQGLADLVMKLITTLFLLVCLKNEDSYKMKISIK